MSRLFTNATSDKIVPGSGVPDLTSVWTIAAWVNRSRASGMNVLDLIWARFTNSTTNRQIAIYVGTGTESKVQVDIPFIAAILTGDTVVSHDGWHHIAVVRNGSTWAIYLDGDLDGSTDNATSQETGGLVELGGSTALGNTYTLDGMLAEVGAWDVALNSSEIAQLQTQSPVYVRVADLVGVWRLEGTTSPEPDSVSTNHGTVTGTSQGSSNPPISYNPPALFRGRNFAFFDDEEVNRFEFWPAISGVTNHERSAAINASGSIESNAQFFSILERMVAIDATGGIESTAQFFSTLERSAVIDGAGAITVSGARVVSRSASLDSSAEIQVSGLAFSVFQSAVSINASGSVEASGISFSVFENSAAIAAAASIVASGSRVVDRSVSISVTGSVETAGTFFTVVDAAAQVGTTASIETASQFFTTFERSIVLDGTALVTVNGQTLQMRQVELLVLGNIAVAGVVIPPSAVEHERSADVGGTGLIAATGLFFSVVQGSGAIDTTALIVTTGQRELSRSVSLTVTATISTSGELPQVEFHPIALARVNREFRVQSISRENRVL